MNTAKDGNWCTSGRSAVNLDLIPRGEPLVDGGEVPTTHKALPNHRDHGYGATDNLARGEPMRPVTGS